MASYGRPNTANGVAALNNDGELAPTLLADGIDANKLADGSVDNAELETLDGVTVNIQTQLNSTVKLTGNQSIAGIKTFTDGTIGKWSSNPSNVIASNVIDCSLGNIFAKTLTANTTFSFTNFTASQTIMLTVVNSASNYTISFANVYWQNGVVPTQTTGASIDMWQFFYDGSKVYGALMPNWILV